MQQRPTENPYSPPNSPGPVEPSNASHMAGRRRSWFWAAITTGVLSLGAGFMATEHASHCGIFTAQGAPAAIAAQDAAQSGILAGTSLGLGLLMVVAWAVSHFKGEPTAHSVLLALLALIVLVHLVMV